LAAANYQFSYVDGTLTVNRRPVTVTANAGQTKIYGELDPTLTYQVESQNGSRGLIATDSFSGSLSRTSGENVASNYAINLGTLANSNYEINLVSQNFAITPRAVTLSANSVSKTYGSADPTLSVAVTSGSLASASVTDTLSEVTGTLSRATGSDVGNYAISLGSGAKASNYDITYVPANLTINKARLVVTGTKVYNGEIEFEAANLTVTGVLGQSFAVSGSATMQTKNVQTAQALANVNGLTITANGNGVLSNYESVATTDTQVSVTRKNISLTAPVLNKTYDGGYTYNMTAADLNAMSQNLVGGDRVVAATVTFADSVVNGVTQANTGKNVGTGKSVNLSAVVISDGNDGNNYNYTLVNTTNNIISPAPLTIRAINDAKFVTKTDAQGYANNCNGLCTGNYAGAIINGFVAGENTSNLSGSLSITRTNSGVESAGTYTGVLQPSGFTSTNYNITYINGDYTIVPAQSLLVRVQPATAQYGNNPTYNITAQYMSANSSTINNLTPIDNGLITINDNAGSSASFVISAVSPSYSSSGKLVVGGYQLAPTATTLTGNNFRSMTFTGSLTVTPKVLSVTELGISGISKVYDGGTNISGLTLNVNSAQSQVRSGDQVSISGTGLYGDRNVGNNKAIDIFIGLSGNDARNYALSNNRVQSASTGIYGTITQLDSVRWVGPATGGRWSNAANWENGALPDGSNVATVNIPVGSRVIYDSALVGQVNSQIVNNGTIEFSGTNNFNFNSNVSGSGSIAQSNVGILTMSGNNSFTGGVSIGNSRLILGHANALGSGAITSNGGYLSTTPNLTLNGNLTVNGDINLSSDIKTVGNQTYNGRLGIANGTATSIDILSVNGQTKAIEVIGTETAKVLQIASSNGGITFNGQVQAIANNSTDKISLEVNALNGVTINQEFGGAIALIPSRGDYSANRFGPNGSYLYDVKINNQTGYGLSNININADIVTAGSQTYGGPVIIGNNGTNGTTRTLVSLDPAITFKSTVDDSSAGVHTLITKAIADTINSPAPIVEYQGEVGSSKKLFELETITGIRAINDSLGQATVNPSETNRFGTIYIRDNVTTERNQTYFANSAVIGKPGVANQSIQFTTNGGEVKYDLGSSPSSGLLAANDSLTAKFRLAGGTLVGESLFTTAGITTERISEPILSTGNNYLNQLKKNLLNTMASDDEAVTASVTIDELQQAPDCPVDSKNPSSNDAECKLLPAA
jgi:hypothetical protein